MPEGAPVSGNAPAGLQKWTSSAHLVVSLLTAVFALYISFQQQRLADAQANLKLQVETQAKTTRYAEDFQEYMAAVAKKEDLESPRGKALKIDLADAMTAAASSATGEIENTRLKHMPMWLALCTGNTDGLRLIAGNAEGRRIWLPMAMQSTDKVVRETAIEVVRTSTDLLPTEILKGIYDLSDELDSQELEEKALTAMQQVLSRMQRRGDPSLEGDDRLVESIRARISNGQASLTGLLAASDLSAEQRASLPRRERLFAATLESFGARETTAMTSTPSATASAPTALASQQSSANREAVKALDSGDVDERRKARDTLASQMDLATAKVLLQTLREENYRVQLGAMVALRDTSINVPLTVDDVKAIVRLIGYNDATMRMHASEFLMKVTDGNTVKVVRRELETIVKNRDQQQPPNPNQVYNAVAVLGTWSRILPDSLAEERESIDTFLKAAKDEMVSKGKWSKTVELIDTLAKLKESQQVAES